MRPKKFKSDFLIIGSGIAGLAFAIKASRLGTVNIVTKKKESDSNTNYAQGGIASVLSPSDSYEKHIEDTMKAGAGLGNLDAVELLVRTGPERIGELMEWGTQFSEKKMSNGSRVLDLGREGGHSMNRIVHARDLTGQEVERALLQKVSEIPNIQLFEDHTGVDLLTEHQLQHEENSAEQYPLLRGLYTRQYHRAGQHVQREDDPAGDGRRRPGVSAHHQSRYRDRRRHRHGLPRGRADRGHGIHPVPPHRALLSQSRQFQLSHQRGGARRRSHPGQRQGRTLHGAGASPERPRPEGHRGADNRHGAEKIRREPTCTSTSPRRAKNSSCAASRTSMPGAWKRGSTYRRTRSRSCRRRTTSAAAW